MNTQHTPGHWVIDDGFVRTEDMIYSMKSNPTWLAVGIEDEDGFAESVAYCHPDNAMLISAAPEMLQALQAVSDYFSGKDSLLASQVNSALAKAKGE